MNPPTIIGNAELIAYSILSDVNIRTGNTQHNIDGRPVQKFYGLTICKYEDDGGFYLFYCDSSWQVITDTYHESIEDAKDQAEFEYTNTRNSWVHVKQIFEQ